MRCWRRQSVVSYLCAALGSDAGRAGRACALDLPACQMAACYCSTGRSGQRELSVLSPLFFSLSPSIDAVFCRRCGSRSGPRLHPAKTCLTHADSPPHTKKREEKGENEVFGHMWRSNSTLDRKIPFSRARFFFSFFFSELQKC